MKCHFFLLALLSTIASASHQPYQPVTYKNHFHTNSRIARWFHDLVGSIIQDYNHYPELPTQFIIEQNIKFLNTRIYNYQQYYLQLKKDSQMYPKNLELQQIVNISNQHFLDHITPFTNEEFAIYSAFTDILHGDQTPHAETLHAMLQEIFPGQYQNLDSLKMNNK